jgi:protoporphyrinogen/coproporphyrinogen III oxidase
MTRFDTIVAGGGITGLGCADLLHEEGRSVLVLEAGERVGGSMRSDLEHGMVLDRGPQSIRSADPELFSHLRGLGLDGERLTPDAESGKRYLVHGGRAVALPATPAAITTPLLSWRAKLRLLREPLVPPWTGGDESVASFFARRLGTEVSDGVLDAVVGGMRAGDPAALSMRAVFPDLFEAERSHGSLLRWGFASARQRRRAAREGRPSPRPQLFNFRSGLESWPAALARRIGRRRVRTDARVVELRRAEGEWLVTWREGDTVRSARAANVVLALPSPDAADLVQPVAPAAAGALRDIAYAPIAVVHLAYPRAAIPHPMDAFGILSPRREGLGILGILWCSSLFPERSPSDLVVTATFIGGVRDAHVVGADDAELARIAHAQHRRLLGAGVEPSFRSVHRWPRAIPQAELGHAERLAAIEAMEASNDGLQVTGSFRNGASVPACWAEGRRVARRILASPVRTGVGGELEPESQAGLALAGLGTVGS